MGKSPNRNNFRYLVFVVLKMGHLRGDKKPDTLYKERVLIIQEP